MTSLQRESKHAMSHMERFGAITSQATNAVNEFARIVTCPF